MTTGCPLAPLPKPQLECLETSGALTAPSLGKPGVNASGSDRPSLQRYLGNKLIVFGQVCSTVDATVCAVAAGQVAAESLGG